MRNPLHIFSIVRAHVMIRMQCINIVGTTNHVYVVQQGRHSIGSRMKRPGMYSFFRFRDSKGRSRHSFGEMIASADPESPSRLLQSI